MKTKPTTVAAYLAALPDDRRAALKAVRAAVRKHLPRGYEEGFGWGMITWSVPLSAYPDTYNGQPLMYAALASQKNYMSFHLACAYMNAPLRKQLADGFEAAGKKLDMGKGCIRFKQLDDLPLDVIGRAVAAVPAKRYVEIARAARSKPR